MKTYLYKVYNSSGTQLITTWTDVLSDPTFSQEINNPAISTVISLGRPYNNYGEGLDVSFHNQVKIYVIDKESPNGSLLFNGFIADYSVILGDREHIDVTVFGFGTELNNYIIESGETVQIDNSTNFGDNIIFAKNGGILACGQTWQATATTTLSRIQLLMLLQAPLDPGFTSADVTLYLYSGSTPGNPANQLIAVSSPQTITNFAFYSFPLTPVAVTSGQTYNFILRSSVITSAGIYVGCNSSTYASGDAYTSFGDGNDYVSQSPKDLILTIYQSGGSTAPSYSSQDPATILESIITDYHNRGGMINYSGSSVDLTNTATSYNFNVNTTLEGVNKVLELSPVGWYYFVDPATNLINLHSVTTATQHNFVLGKDFNSLEFDKRSEDIINTIYFTGGVVAGNNLYVKYTNSTSIGSYGAKLQNYVDQRVTLRATADTIANTILQAHSQPEIRVMAEIIDSNLSGYGFDIETIKVGDIAAFRGIDNSVGAQWDVAKWDTAFWDFNIAQINTLILQITRIEYSPGSVKIICSTIPPDVNKRIEDINRNLNASVTTNNPSTYSS